MARKNKNKNDFIEKEKEIIEERLEQQEKEEEKVDEVEEIIKERIDQKAYKKAVVMRDKVLYKYSRCCAYLIDILIVVALATLLTNNAISNPFYGTSGDAFKEYKNIYESEVSKAEEDGSISEEEVLTVLKKSSTSFRIYTIRANFAFDIWFVLLYFFYFGIFAYMNNGATIGKKMYHLKVVDESGRNASLIQMMVRNLVGGNRIFTNLNVTCMIISALSMVLLKNGLTFTYAYIGINLLCITMDVVVISMFIFKKNGRSLDDILGKTKVIRTPMKKVLK